MEWLDKLLEGKIEKEAMDSVGKDAKETFERKVKAHDWIKSVSELDPEQVDKEYQAKLAEEAKLLGKTAAYEMGDTTEETLKKDYRRDVEILSDYALAEMVAGIRGHAEQNTPEMFSTHKEEAKKNVASNRKKVEEEVLKATGMSAQVDWQKEFARYSKQATPEQPKEKDLFQPMASEKDADFSKPSEDKYKMPTKEEMVPAGNGREADERTEVTKQAVPVIKEASQVEASPEEIEKEAASNQAVIETFVSGQGGARSANLAISKHLDGSMVLINYETPMAYRAADGTLYLNSDKYSVTTSKIQNYIRNAAGGQIKEVPSAVLQKVMHEPVAKEAHCGSCPGDPGHEQAMSPLKREELPVEVKAEMCPVCGSEGKDLQNNEKDHYSCMGCGISYGHKEGSCGHCGSLDEIKSCASKEEVIKKVAELNKQAEVSSPWIVTKDAEGNEVIARVEQLTNKKESEEDKVEELKK